MVLLAHVRSQFFTSHETYGSPSTTVELNEAGVAVGRKGCPIDARERPQSLSKAAL